MVRGALRSDEVSGDGGEAIGDVRVDHWVGVGFIWRMRLVWLGVGVRDGLGKYVLGVSVEAWGSA